MYPDWNRELYTAYLSARKHKRNTFNQLSFEANLEENLLILGKELESRRYEISPAECFINEKPVKREIVAADFRDRVVHHLLFNWINPLFEKHFIYDSYSCRVGKGTLFGINRAKAFVLSESDFFRKECFVLRLDISGFFMGIHRGILCQSILDLLSRSKWKNVPDRELAEFLIQKIVFNDPLKNARFKSPREAWKDLPPNKSLRYSKPGCGLPIGNLTSQLFGNVYLNPLDHYVKRTLKFRHYGRYVDDMVLVSTDKRKLIDSIPQIRGYLKEKLRLELHPKKIYLQPVQKGFAFLGAFILPHRVYPGRRLIRNFRECQRNPLPNPKEQGNRLASYLGCFSHFDSYGIVQKEIGMPVFQS